MGRPVALPATIWVTSYLVLTVAETKLMSHLYMPELIIHFHLSSVNAVEKPQNIPEKWTILEFSLFYYRHVE